MRIIDNANGERDMSNIEQLKAQREEIKAEYDAASSDDQISIATKLRNIEAEIETIERAQVRSEKCSESQKLFQSFVDTLGEDKVREVLKDAMAPASSYDKFINGEAIIGGLPLEELEYAAAK